MNHDRHARHPSCDYDRHAHISAFAENNVRLELVNNPQALNQSRWNFENIDEIFQRKISAKFTGENFIKFDFQSMEDGFFKTSAFTDVRNNTAGALRFPLRAIFFYNRGQREHMSRCPAAYDK